MLNVYYSSTICFAAGLLSCNISHLLTGWRFVNKFAESDVLLSWKTWGKIIANLYSSIVPNSWKNDEHGQKLTAFYHNEYIIHRMCVLYKLLITVNGYFAFEMWSSFFFTETECFCSGERNISGTSPDLNDIEKKNLNHLENGNWEWHTNVIEIEKFFQQLFNR